MSGFFDKLKQAKRRAKEMLFQSISGKQSSKDDDDFDRAHQHFLEIEKHLTLLHRNCTAYQRVVKDLGTHHTVVLFLLLKTRRD